MLSAFTIFLCSCKDDNSKNALCDVLYSCYSAKADYMIQTKEKCIEGSLELLRSDKSRINFLTPDEYSSVIVSGDSVGNADVFTFELYGIPASIPKSFASNISLLFSLFSDEVPSRIMSLDDNNFTYYENDGTSSVSFSENNINYNIIYSHESGIPKAMNVSDDKSSVSISFTEFKLSEK